VQSDGGEGTIVGGFSDVSGLGREVSCPENESGNKRFNATRKVPNSHKHGDVTLKRGVVGSDDLFQWLKSVRSGTVDPRQVTITLLNEAGERVATWTLRNAQPKKIEWPDAGGQGRR
jgi:phage tail-like protein